MWFDILKVLGTKSGYAQLDFDNIAEGEDDNCKRRWQQICDKLSNVDIEGFEKIVTTSYRGYAKFMALPEDNPSDAMVIRSVNFGEIIYEYGTEIPEEVYCAALDLLGTDDAFKDVGEFSINRHKKENELGTSNLVSIAPLKDHIDNWKVGKNFARIGYLTSNRFDIKEMLPRLREKIKTILPKFEEAFPY